MTGEEGQPALGTVIQLVLQWLSGQLQSFFLPPWLPKGVQCPDWPSLGVAVALVCHSGMGEPSALLEVLKLQVSALCAGTVEQ